MKKWFVICILCLCLSGCGSDDSRTERKVTSTPDIESEISSPPNDSVEMPENDMAVLIIGPTGAMGETYLIELSKDGVLTTTLGTRKEDDVSDIKTYEEAEVYLSIEKKESMTLSDNAFSTVDELIDKMETEDNSRYESFMYREDDSWENVLVTSNGMYCFYLSGIDINSSLYKLYDFLKSKSPMEINMHAWI